MGMKVLMDGAISKFSHFQNTHYSLDSNSCNDLVQI